MAIKRKLGLAGACLLALVFSNLGKAQPMLPPFTPSPLLDSWRFDDDLWWSGFGYPPLAFTNLQSAPSFEGNSVEVDGSQPAYLQYAILQDDGHFSLGIPQGTIFLWAQPNWSSQATNGSGPTNWATLLSVGSWAADVSNSWASLFISPDGNTLYLASATNESAVTAHVWANIAWTAGDWHNVVVCYDSQSCNLFLDGSWIATGPGIALGDQILSNAFSIGALPEGTAQFHGQIDLLRTWDRPATFDEVTNYYAEVYNAYFGSGTSGSSSGPGFFAPGGLSLLGGCACVTNGPAYLTNLSAVITNNSVNFSFCVLGGTNGIPYDLWSAPALNVTNHFANTWSWLGTVNTCTNYMLTNQNLVGSFYCLSASPAPCYPDAQVMFVIDRSTNMVDTTPSNNLQLAQYCASNIIHRLNLSNYDSAGLVTWSSSVATNQVLTNDLITLSNAIASISDTGAQNTSASDAIYAAQAELTSARRDPRAKPVIVFMSEGLNNNVNLSTTQTNGIAAASYARSLGTRFITVAIGKDAYTNFLKTLAANSSDFYWASLTNTGPLTNVFDSIAASICRYTNAPTVQITNPINGFVFAAGTNLTLSAVATCDAVLSITNVQFLSDGGSLGSMTHAPYSLTWSNVPSGTHLLVAKVTDSSGASELSGCVVISSHAPPPFTSVSFVSPTNGQLFVISPTNISITATSSDFSSTAVAIYNGSTKLAQSSGTSCQFLWTNVAAGSYTLNAYSTNILGISASASVTITNNAVPAVTITSPTNFQGYLEVTNVTISGTVSDSDGSVTNVTLFSGTNVGTATLTGTNFTLVWSNRHAGAYPIMAVATDNRGAPSPSAIKVFKVSSTNLPPTVAITYPTNNQVFAAGSDITITAIASATNGASITNVAFFVGTNLLGNDPTSPYSLTRCCWSAGTYVLSALATDSHGASMVSSQITITVGSPVSMAGDGSWTPDFGNPLADPGHFRYATANALAVDGSGNLFFGGDNFGDEGTDYNYFTNNYLIAEWDGGTWRGVLPNEGGVQNVNTILFSGNILFEGSTSFGTTNSTNFTIVQQWDGTNWTQTGDDLLLPQLLVPGSSALGVGTLAVVASDLFAGGDFYGSINNGSVQYIARLVGTNWVPVGNGLTMPANGAVRAIVGVGNTLYIGGDFTAAGGNTNICYLARLAGNTWTNVGGGVNATVRALAACGNDLYVGGDFSAAGGNTNAHCIAQWNGTNWNTLGQGVSGTPLLDDPLAWPVPSVLNISLHGKEVFVGGQFDTAYNGADSAPLAVNNVAVATWDEASQAWTWYDLDGGVSYPGQPSYVTASTLLATQSTNRLDYYVAGFFYLAGQVNSTRVAHWSVGPTNPVQIAISSPTNRAVIPADTLISLTAFVLSNPTTNSVDTVQFLFDGADFGSGSAPDYTTMQPTGDADRAVHQLVALAYHNVGGVTNALLAKSAPVFLTFAQPTNTVAAQDDFFTLGVNSPAVTLNVLANDLSSISNKLSIVSVIQIHTSVGTAQVSHDRLSLTYQLHANTYGTGFFQYSVTDGVSTNFAWVTVNIRDLPAVTITSPTGAPFFAASSNLSVSGYASVSDSAITNVALMVNGLSYAKTNTDNFAFVWSTNAVGFYTFTAMATDAYGITNVSAPVTIAITNSSTATNVLAAAITYPLLAVTNLGGFQVTNAVLIRDGIITNTGSAYDSNPGDTVSYQILLLDPANPNAATPLYNVTPAPRDAEGFYHGSVTNGTLGVLDLSLVQNGCYLLTLVVRGGGGQTSASVLIAVDSNLKLGQFSFSQQDLTLPVNGLPLTLTRTYNSINPRSGDFGYGWMFAFNAMDVQLDEQRIPVTIGSDAAPCADMEEDDNGLPLVVSIRTGGSRDVTLTLPDGRRTTFAFNPRNANANAYAQWTPPPEIGASITLTPMDSGMINFFEGLAWQSAPQDCTFDAYDVPGWVLQTQDHTQYKITRGAVNNVTYDVSGEGNYITVPTYGPPQLTEIDEPTGDKIIINPNCIYHQNSNGVTTRAITMDRDGQGRITAIYDPVSQASGPQSSTLSLQPTVRYIYDNDSGNLVQVLKLVDRTAGTYVTNKYHYDNPSFPHYITSIDDANGATPIRTLYNDAGQMIGTIDAFGKTNTFIPTIASQSETVIDALGNTNTYFCDTRGNVTSVIDALGHVTQKAYDASNNVIMSVDALYHTNFFGFDGQGNQIASTNALGYTNGAVFDLLGHVLTNIDARGFSTAYTYDQNTGNLLATTDALNNTTSNFYNGQNLLAGARDPLGTVSTNYYDSSGNLIAMATLSVSGAILSTNSFAYDDNGNRTNSIVWRRVNGVWIGATTTYILDAQNRVTQTINPDGGTNIVIFDNNGRAIITIDPLGHRTTNVFDDMGRQISTLYADSSSTYTTYDANGRQIATTNQLGYFTQYFYDDDGRQTTVVYPDLTTNLTVFDAAGRVHFTIDAHGFTNAPGYDALGQQTSTTNALGKTEQAVTTTIFDGNGNPIYNTDANGQTTTNVFDALNRTVQIQYADGTKTSTGFDAAGRRIAETNQDLVVTLYGNDGVGRLVSVTNAVGTTEQITTRYVFDEAGNEIYQIDALGRTNAFVSDSMGRRIQHTMPAGQSESLGYDLAGNQTLRTNFNGIVITNQYDMMNRQTNRSSIGGYQVSYTFTFTGQRQTMTDASGTTMYIYDTRDRLKTNSAPQGILYYSYDLNGNVTNIWSATTNGVNLAYQLDALNRVTNVLDHGVAAAGYGFDLAGNLQATRLGNGITNVCQFDLVNHLTNMVWKSNATTMASFAYQLGLIGNRIKLVENLDGTQRTNAWFPDRLYRLTNETVTASAGSTGSLAYGLDFVGNRTNRSGGIGPLGSQTLGYGANDWLTNDLYDANGSTTNSGGKTCQYDVENRLTNYNNGAVTIVYNGDGNRASKTVGGVTTLYLVDTLNPSGYAQVLEESTLSSGSTNLTRRYAYGLALISQCQPGIATNFFVSDGHGSTRLLLDAGGNVANAFAFDAYGSLIASNVTPQTAYLYCSEQFDADLGHYYLRARLLNPNTGRFWTSDTDEGDQEDPLSLHKYLFCEADPVNMTDPSGHDSLDSMRLTVFAAILLEIDAPLRDWPKNQGVRLLTAVIFAESTAGKGEDAVEKLAIGATVFNDAFYAVPPKGQKHNYNKAFGDGTILGALKAAFPQSYMKSRWKLVAGETDLKPQATLNQVLQFTDREHYNLSVDAASAVKPPPMGIKEFNNEAPIGFNQSKKGAPPNPDREHLIGAAGVHKFYGFDKGHEYQ